MGPSADERTELSEQGVVLAVAVALDSDHQQRGAGHGQHGAPHGEPGCGPALALRRRGVVFQLAQGEPPEGAAKDQHQPDADHGRAGGEHRDAPRLSRLRWDLVCKLELARLRLGRVELGLREALARVGADLTEGADRIAPGPALSLDAELVVRTGGLADGDARSVHTPKPCAALGHAGGRRGDPGGAVRRRGG